MNPRITLLAAGLGSCIVAQAQAFTVHGIERDCGSIVQLDRAMSIQDGRFFLGWEVQDFSDAISWSEACRNFGWQFAKAGRVERLQIMQKRLKDQREADAHSAEVAANEKAQAAAAAEAGRREQETVAQQRAEAAEAARLQAVCEATPTAQRFKFQEQVITDLDLIASTKADQARERKIAANSGVRNLTNDYQNGAYLVDLEADLQGDFKAYKKAGGRAASPKLVRHDLADPC